MGLGRLKKDGIYEAIREAHQRYGYSIRALCQIGNVTRAAYYKWINRKTPDNEKENVRLSKVIETIHELHPDKGYRRIKDDLERYHNTKVNDKRVLRICRKLNIKSTIKYASQGCTRQSTNPQHTAENVLNREFKADKPNEKWLTDVTEFKYYISGEKKKLYLSAIIDLYDRRIVSYVVSDRNDNALVFETFDLALQEAPNATPLFHSDRGFQYTNRSFYKKLMAAGMTQSMSRVGKCIDNGPIEGFWGILKREQYYGKRFTTKEGLLEMINEYITYYNNKRLQRKLGVLTPFEKHQLYLQAA